MLACFLAATRLPVSHVHIGQSFGHGLRQFLSDRRWLLFLATILIGAVGLSTVHGFLFLYMKDLGASRSLMGVALAVATLSELVVFFYSGRLLERWGTRAILVASLIAHIVRLVGYSVVRSPELVLVVQLLHGPTFSLIWVAGVSYANQAAPRGLGATAQGLLTAIYFGLGSTAGGLVGGYLYDHLGPFRMFFWAGICVLGGLILFVALGSSTDRVDQPAESRPDPDVTGSPI